MTVQPYIFFDGRCEEALNFYRATFGAEITMMMRFSENPDPQPMPGSKPEKIMHAAFTVNGTMVMASDGHCAGQPKFEGFALALSLKDEAEAKRVFAALGDGGTVAQPLMKTFFSPAFGMLKDRFGVMWMVMVG
ncbi:VOC family protein [Leptolyngbya sp. 15MV]|nr:VOC family protein [Leptolyngbya sp. 15MV]